MKHTAICLAVGILLSAVVTSSVHAQKGMGEPTGMARQAVKPRAVTLSGKVVQIETGPCENTTGPALIGTHFLLETPAGKTLNIHLGPADTVDFVTQHLPVGKRVTVNAFHTKRMKQDHYVAQSIAHEGGSIQLRDENLRPVWARSNTASRDRSTTQQPRRQGRGWGQRGWNGGRQRGRAWGRQWR